MVHDSWLMAWAPAPGPMGHRGGKAVLIDHFFDCFSICDSLIAHETNKNLTTQKSKDQTLENSKVDHSIPTASTTHVSHIDHHNLIRDSKGSTVATNTNTHLLENASLESEHISYGFRGF